jgi:hypothetical protein
VLKKNDLYPFWDSDINKKGLPKIFKQTFFELKDYFIE